MLIQSTLRSRSILWQVSVLSCRIRSWFDQGLHDLGLNVSYSGLCHFAKTELFSFCLETKRGTNSTSSVRMCISWGKWRPIARHVSVTSSPKKEEITNSNDFVQYLSNLNGKTEIKKKENLLIWGKVACLHYTFSHHCSPHHKVCNNL